MSGRESLEEFEFDDLSRDITKLTALITEVGIRKEKKRPVSKELKEIKDIVAALKDTLLEAGQKPRPSPKATSGPVFTAAARISTRKLFLHVQKGLEIGYDEQFTTTLRSLAEMLRTSLKKDGVHSNAGPPKIWQPADDDYPRASRCPRHCENHILIVTSSRCLANGR
jgi:hypothetical protein